MNYVRQLRTILLSLSMLLSFKSLAATPPYNLSLNQVQVVGTHNSYKDWIHPSLWNLMFLIDAEGAKGLDYGHWPIPFQLQKWGIRQLELDIYHDPEGGLFSRPAGRMILGDSFPSFQELQEPGFKVLHIPDIDFASTCLTLKSCLTQIRDWSSANPHHLPIMILMELKEDGPTPSSRWAPIIREYDLELTRPRKFDSQALDELDRLILSIFKRKQIITPDDVRGDHSTLRQAILNKGWPTVDESRGKTLFALDNGGRLRDLYVADHPSLKKRVLFVQAEQVESAEAAFFKVNDPTGDNFLRIQTLVRQGFLVRTRADADTKEARRGDYFRQLKALQSGAQYISTDYPIENPRFETGYVMKIPETGFTRCIDITEEGLQFQECSLLP